MSSVLATVRQLKECGEDLEWYPTTDEIIRVITDHVVNVVEIRHPDVKSVLDIGAGDGRVLMAFQRCIKGLAGHRDLVELFAIEKAVTHLSAMPKEIVVIGTDFLQQTLVDKEVDAIFCNPPYSEFEAWTLRIAREASTRNVYLVIPRRWRDNVEIKHALETRYAKVTSLGEFDFEDADRRARAKVEVVYIRFNGDNCDAFESVLKDMLPELDIFDVELAEAKEEPLDSLVNGGRNLVEVLADAYQAELLKMLENYRAALRVDVTVLSELGIDKDKVLSGIRQKIHGLKNKYWKSLFDEMSTITERLATRQRRSFLDSLKGKVNVDFTAENAYAVLIWVSKWANDYFDEQLIDLFRTLSNDSNTERYKSNQRLWVETGWRYGKKYHFDGSKDSATHYKLEYRMVLSHGGICRSESRWSSQRCHGLMENAFDLLCDIATVANNLGFPCKDGPKNYEWKSNKKNVLMLNDGTPLVAARAFVNGNMHLQFNPKFMLAVNVEAGRLLGWLRSGREACEELQVPAKDAEQVSKIFGSSFRISPDTCVKNIESSVPESAVAC